MERRTLQRPAALNRRSIRQPQTPGFAPRPAILAFWPPATLLTLRSLAILACCLGAAQPAWCQIRIQVGGRPAFVEKGEDGENLEGVFLPPDRHAKQKLERAGESIRNQQYSDASERLGSLLEGPEDFFFKSEPGDSVYRSLKAEAGRLIGEMPAEGRESYELQFGARARHLLSEAVADGDISAVAEVARRFFYTKAGLEATLLVARDHLDHERPLATALLLERVRGAAGASERFEPLLSLTLATAWVRAGARDKAQQALVQLKRQMPQEVLHIGDRQVRWFNDPKDSLTWLAETAGAGQPAQRGATADEWLVYRGDAARNAASSGGQPLLNRRWQTLMAIDSEWPKETIKAINELRQRFGDEDYAALPSMQPLAVGNLVLARTVRRMAAIDFATGKLLWEYPSSTDRSSEQVVNQHGRNGSNDNAQLTIALEQRMWDDAIFGNITSDGQQVFSIEGLPLVGTNNPLMHLANQGQIVFNNGGINGRRVIMANGRDMSRSNVRTSNRLMARELKTEGKLKWSVGGPSGDDEPKLAGAFFLGPPLPLLGRLYVLAEMKGQDIRLEALNAKTGRLEWSQQLAVVEVGVQYDQYRRGAGAVPSFADGILVCPTSAGALVAVDLTTRSLLWGYQYPRTPLGGFFNPQAFNNNPFYNSTDRQNGDRWVDSETIIADGHVLATPVEGDKLYCLSLVDGKLLWKLDRSDGNNASYLYVAGVSQGRVILVGHRHMAAVRLADGKPAWGPIELPGGAVPSGRGFLSGSSYFLPLSTAEIAEIDLEKGTVVNRARSRQGVVPGNLICYRGDIISQNVDFIEVYPQLAALKKTTQETLARTPDDPTALAQSGEIRLDEGDIPAAIGLLRRSYEVRPDDGTRELLVESLLAGLETNFVANRQTAQELEGLLETKEQRGAYLRLTAIGLERAGEVRAAFDAFLKIAEDERGLTRLEPMGDAVQVRRDRWIRGHLLQLWDAADADARLYIDSVIQTRADALASAPAAALEKLLNLFGSLPATDGMRELLVQKLSGSETWLKREQLLLRLLKSPDPARVRGATAQLAALLREASRPELAAIYYRQLAGPLAEQVCWQGQTGGQIVAALSPENPVRPLLAEPKPFPVGVVESKLSGGRMLGGRIQVSYDLELRGQTGPFFTDVNLALDRQQSSLVAEDGMGQERFRVSLAENDPPRRASRAAMQVFNNPAMNYAAAHGNQLFLWMGYQLVALDTLRAKDSTGSRVQWVQELQTLAPSLGNNVGVHQRQLNVPWGAMRSVPQTPNGRPIGTLGPVSDDGVCFQRFRDLACVDPLTGADIWVRKGLPLGCQIFGDDEVVIAAPPEGGEALVLRRLDGELLAKRDVAPLEHRMTTIGRLLLTWRPQNGRWMIRLSDLWKDTTLWSREAEFGSKGDMLGEELLGVVESGRRFSLIRVADGQVLLDHEKLLAEHSLLNIHLLSSPDAVLLMTNHPSMKASGDNIQTAPKDRLYNPLVNGHLYGFDRTSGKRLWGPVKIEQQGLLLHQPAQLPLLVFARHIHRTAEPNQPHDQRTTILAIDKRTGRKVFEDERAMSGQIINNLQMTGDRKEGTVTLMLPAKTITLKLTDKELPPEPVEKAAEKKTDPLKSAAEAVNKILEGVLKPIKPEENIDD